MDPHTGPGPAVGTSSEELRALGDLTGEGLAGAVTIAADAHRAVVDRVESLLPPIARPVTGITRAIASGVFAAVRASTRRAPVAAAEVLARTPLAQQPVVASPAGRQVLPLVNGLWGDRVTRGRPSLAIPMALRHGERDLAPTRPSLSEAFAAPSPHVVMFVHGLMESDQSWRPPATDGAQPLSFGDRLERDLAVTAAYVRYDSGLRVSRNGELLSHLLRELVEAWPVPVQRITLVGHSMGGLVARSAAHVAAAEGHEWGTRLATVATLGTPHLGAPLAKAAHVAAWGLARSSQTAAYARILAARSAGIRDLRHGAVVPADWQGRDHDGLLVDPPTRPDPLPHVTYAHLAATITRDPEHPVGRLVGDGMVRRPSASGHGRTRRLHFHPRDGAVVGSVGHLAMLHHPEVYAVLADWVGGGADPRSGGTGPAHDRATVR